MHISKTNAIENSSHVRSELQKNLAQIGWPGTPQAGGLPGPGTSERLNSLIDSYEVRGRDFQDGRSLLRTADGALGEIEGLVIRMRDLAQESEDVALSEEERGALQVEFTLLRDELDRIASSTEHNGVRLLDGSRSEVVLQLGTQIANPLSVTLQGARAVDLGLEGIDISSAGGGAAALEGIDEALQSLTSQRDGLGEADAKLVSLNRSLGQARDSLLATQDLARTVASVIENARLVSHQLKQQGRNSLLVQGNLLRSTVQSLLGQ